MLTLTYLNYWEVDGWWPLSGILTFFTSLHPSIHPSVCMSVCICVAILHICKCVSSFESYLGISFRLVFWMELQSLPSKHLQIKIIPIKPQAIMWYSLPNVFGFRVTQNQPGHAHWLKNIDIDLSRNVDHPYHNLLHMCPTHFIIISTTHHNLYLIKVGSQWV